MVIYKKGLYLKKQPVNNKILKKQLEVYHLKNDESDPSK